MNTYIISYDLISGGSYDMLYKEIKDYGIWAKITESLWAIKTNESAVDVRNKLSNHIPEKSRLFVIKSGVESAWKNAICSNEWLKENL